MIKIRVDLRCARIGVIRVLFYGTLTTLIKIRGNSYCLGIRVISVLFYPLLFYLYRAELMLADLRDFLEYLIFPPLTTTPKQLL